MPEPAIKPMTLDEFLRWDDGTETHYELLGGFPVAMKINSPDITPPVAMLGHVTSSYHSAFLGRSIAMGFVIDGIKRRNEEGNDHIWLVVR